MLVGHIHKKRMRQILWQKFHAAERASVRASEYYSSSETRAPARRERERERERVRVLATSVAECTQSSAALSRHWIVQGITDRAKLGGLL
jgi:hypothetical protein